MQRLQNRMSCSMRWFPQPSTKYHCRVFVDFQGNRRLLRQITNNTATLLNQFARPKLKGRCFAPRGRVPSDSHCEKKSGGKRRKWVKGQSAQKRITKEGKKANYFFPAATRKMSQWKKSEKGRNNIPRKILEALFSFGCFALFLAIQAIAKKKETEDNFFYRQKIGARSWRLRFADGWMHEWMWCVATRVDIPAKPKGLRFPWPTGSTLQRPSTATPLSKRRRFPVQPLAPDHASDHHHIGFPQQAHLLNDHQHHYHLGFPPPVSFSVVCFIAR